jgi:hypothetical protein
MTYTTEVEWVENGEDILLEVEFEGYPKWDNDGYQDEYGTAKDREYVTMANSNEVTWNKSLYNDHENSEIQKWLYKDEYRNLKHIEIDLCAIFEDEQNSF